MSLIYLLSHLRESPLSNTYIYAQSYPLQIVTRNWKHLSLQRWRDSLIDQFVFFLKRIAFPYQAIFQKSHGGNRLARALPD